MLDMAISVAARATSSTLGIGLGSGIASVREGIDIRDGNQKLATGLRMIQIAAAAYCIAIMILPTPPSIVFWAITAVAVLLPLGKHIFSGCLGNTFSKMEAVATILAKLSLLILTTLSVGLAFINPWLGAACAAVTFIYLSHSYMIPLVQSSDRDMSYCSAN